jgi:hypothetical protein
VTHTGHHASNSASKLLLGSFYVLVTLASSPASASTVTSRPAQAFDEDEHSKYCRCGPACRKESCCCGPRKTGSGTRKPLAAPPQSRVDLVGNTCLIQTPCHESGLPSGPTVTSCAKAAALDVRASLAHPDCWERLWQDCQQARPHLRDSRLDRPPEVRLASR